MSCIVNIFMLIKNAHNGNIHKLVHMKSISCAGFIIGTWSAMRNMFLVLLVLAGLAEFVSCTELSFVVGSKRPLLQSPAGADDAVSISYERNVSGWNYLSVISNQIPTSPKMNFDIFYSAGYGEGVVTCEEVQQTYPNFIADNFGESTPSKELVAFLQDNYMWMKAEADANFETSAYWFTIKSVLRQMDGMLDGYLDSNCAITMKSKLYSDSGVVHSGVASDLTTVEAFSMMHLLLMNAWGDLYAIMTKVGDADSSAVSKYAPSSSQRLFTSADSPALCASGNNTVGDKRCLPAIHRHRLPYPKTEIDKDLRCSSLVKLLPDYSDLFFGHTTWGSYVVLGPRIFKRYVLPALVEPATATASAPLSFELRDISFSSSPALLASLDDFYVVTSPSARLAVMETSLDQLNPALVQKVVFQTNLCWVRAIAANRLAVDGASWAAAFGKLHSGTYPNQWQVVDLSVFVPGQKPVPGSGLLTVLEEVPGLVTSRDMTGHLLEEGYWPSYNIPYFPDIALISGNSAACEVHVALNGDHGWCLESCPRANIFRTRQADALTLSAVRDLLQYNDWQSDALSLNDSCNAIACRRDLELQAVKMYPSGGLDGKVSSAALVRAALSATPSTAVPVHVRLGPTSDDQPVFCWSQLEQTYTHVGQPDCFNFSWAVFP